MNNRFIDPKLEEASPPIDLLCKAVLFGRQVGVLFYKMGLIDKIS